MRDHFRNYIMRERLEGVLLYNIYAQNGSLVNTVPFSRVDEYITPNVIKYVLFRLLRNGESTALTRTGKVVRIVKC